MKKRKANYNYLKISLIFFIVGETFSFAQGTPEVIKISSLSEAFDYALASNPDIEIYQLQQEEAQVAYKASKSYLYPNVSGSFSGQYNINLQTTPLPGELVGAPGTTFETQFGQPYAYNAGITASMNLLSWQARLNAQISNLQIEVIQHQEQSFQQNLKEQIALFYYSTIITQQALALNEKDLEVADSILVLTQQKFEQGLVDQLAVNQAKVNVNSIQQNMLNNQNYLEQSKIQLCILLGFSLESSIQLTEEITSSEQDDISLALLPDRYIKVLESQVQQAALNVKLERSAYLPSLNVNYYLGQQQFRDDFGISFGNDAWSDFSYLGLNISVPIFSGFANKNKVSASKVRQEIAEKQYLEQKRKTALQDSLLLTQYQNSKLAAQAYYNNFKLFEENEALVLAKYQQGFISLDSYFKAFEDYLNAENAYLNALSTLYSHYATIISRQ